MSTTSPTALKDGKVVAIAGPVIDVEFPRGSLPELNQALEFTIKSDGKDVTVLAEVAQQLGNSRVRVVCMKPTDGLRRGTPVRNTGHGIQVPVGDKTLGHVWNVWGECLDGNNDDFKDVERWDIHRPAPDFAALEPSRRMFETGIKVIDLLTLSRWWKNRLVRLSWCRQNRSHYRNDQPRGLKPRWCVGVRWRGRAHS